MPTTHETKSRSRSIEPNEQDYPWQEAGAGEAAVALFKEFARERPEVVAMWAFGVGFVLGWKLRIW